MKRLCLLSLLMGVLSLSAEARQQQAPPPPPRLSPQEQMQIAITDLYIKDFQSAFPLTLEQFLKINPPLRMFMEERFRLYSARLNISQQIQRLEAQPNSPRQRLNGLLAERTMIDNRI